MKHERETLEAVIEARNSAVSRTRRRRPIPAIRSAMKQLGGAETGLTQTLGRLFAVSEAYPDLKANQNMMQLTEELTSTENKISFARQAYNDSVMSYNNRREMFPGLGRRRHVRLPAGRAAQDRVRHRSAKRRRCRSPDRVRDARDVRFPSPACGRGQGEGHRGSTLRPTHELLRPSGAGATPDASHADPVRARGRRDRRARSMASCCFALGARQSASACRRRHQLVVALARAQRRRRRRDPARFAVSHRDAQRRRRGGRAPARRHAGRTGRRQLRIPAAAQRRRGNGDRLRRAGAGNLRARGRSRHQRVRRRLHAGRRRGHRHARRARQAHARRAARRDRPRVQPHPQRRHAAQHPPHGRRVRHPRDRDDRAQDRGALRTRPQPRRRAAS